MNIQYPSNSVLGYCVLDIGYWILRFMKKLNSKRVKESITENTYVVLPGDTNPLGNLFGGTMMSWIDVTASIVALRHCGSIVVTAAMDDLFFIHPVKLGDVVTMKASINFASKHSVEVGVKVFAETATKQIKKHTASAYLTMVALDEKGKVKKVPSIDPQTEDEQRRYKQAQQRREWRLGRKTKVY